MSERVFFSMNNRVAVEPFPEASKAEVKNGVLQPMNTAALTPLTVVFGAEISDFDEGLLPGDVVYVRTKLRNSTTYGKEVFEANGQKFILIPLEEIVLVDAQIHDSEGFDFSEAEEV
jgi:hypothetical protein